MLRPLAAYVCLLQVNKVSHLLLLGLLVACVLVAVQASGIKGVDEADFSVSLSK